MSVATVLVKEELHDINLIKYSCIHSLFYKNDTQNPNPNMQRLWEHCTFYSKSKLEEKVFKFIHVYCSQKVKKN